MKFIKLNVLNATTSDNDTVIHLRPENVIEITKPNNQDHKQRLEIGAIVTTKNCSYAVEESVDEVIRLVEEAEL